MLLSCDLFVSMVGMAKHHVVIGGAKDKDVARQK